MATRPTTTLLLLTRSSIVRADFARDNTLVDLWKQAQPDVQDWPTLVEIALGKGQKPGRTVFVLSSDLWTQTLEVPNVSTVNMPANELAAALNFEAEALSGLSAFESTIAVQTLPGGQGHWIVQTRSADFEQANQIVMKAGARLGGIAHPGGVPVPLGQGSGRWVRMEFWPDAVVFLRGESAGLPSVQVLNADPQLGRWKSEWANWSQGVSVADQESLAGPGMTLAPVAQSFALDDDETLSHWLTAWAKRLSGKSPGVPLLRPAKPPISGMRCAAIAVGLAIPTIALCVAVHLFLSGMVKVRSDEWKHLQQHTKESADLKKQVEELRSKQADLQTQMANLENSLKVLGTHRQRIAKLLTTLRDVRHDDLYVEKIEVDAGEPKLSGHCLHPQLADQFASKLAMALSEHGWEVQSPKKKGLEVATNGGPWAFDIQFRGAKGMTIDTSVYPKKSKSK